jgi:hypothetical protein
VVSHARVYENGVNTQAGSVGLDRLHDITHEDGAYIFAVFEKLGGKDFAGGFVYDFSRPHPGTKNWSGALRVCSVECPLLLIRKGAMDNLILADLLNGLKNI